MADVVQYRLERMLNALDDLERRGLFTRRELAEVVKQRRKFEYRLKRPSPLKQDFLAYIEFETHFDELRHRRKKSISRELKKLDDNGDVDAKKKGLKTSFSDNTGVNRIIDIYGLAVTRFKGDINLWFRYLEFCRERKSRKMKKVLAKAIRFHPKVPELWIYAAAWEFDYNLNVAAARALMQSGLRVCPSSEDLWIEYLRMELTYLNKLKARKVALGEDEGTLTRNKTAADQKQWRDENDDLFMSLNEGSKETIEKTDMFREQGFNILRTVYEGAIEALPSSFSLRKRFLEILDGVDLAHTDEMREQILGEMRAKFSTDPEFWDWLARLEFDTDNIDGMGEDLVRSRAQKAIQVYKEALEALPSSSVFDVYAKFLMGLIVPIRGESEVSSLSDDYAIYVPLLLTVYEKAEAMSCLTEELACQYISLYLQLGRVEEAKKLAEKLCQKLPDSINLWTMRVSIEARNVTKSDLQSLYELIRSVLIKTPVKKAESLWLTAFKLFLSKKEYFEKLVELSVLATAKHGGSDDGFSLSSAIVNFVFQRDGIQQARDMYKRFLALPHPGLAIYINCIEMESNFASIGDKDGLSRTRKLYDSALTTYAQNASLWKNYHRLETEMGTSETASSVSWRARKILKDASALISLDL